MIVCPVVLNLRAVWFPMLEFSLSKFVSILYVVLPTLSCLLSCISIMRDLRGFSPNVVSRIPQPHPCPRNNHLKVICFNPYMPHFIFFHPNYVVLLHRCSRYPVSAFPIYPESLVSLRVALFLDNIRAQAPLVAKPNHCILIARYFVSRCPSSMYYTVSLV